MYGLISLVWGVDHVYILGQNPNHAIQQNTCTTYLQEEAKTPPVPVLWECDEDDADTFPLSPLELTKDVLATQEINHLIDKLPLSQDDTDTQAEMAVARCINGEQFTDDVMMPVQDPHLNHYAAYVKLALDFGGIPRIGSGVMISPRHILTCGHNIYEMAYDGRRIWAEKVTAIPAAGHDGYSPLGEYACARMHAHPEWEKSPNRENDLAVLVLDDDLSQIAGFMGVGVLEGAVAGEEVVLCGYPMAKGNGKMTKFPETPKERMDCMVGLWQRSGVLLSLSTDRLLRYRIPSYGGQSGSGLVKRCQDQSFVIGIHSGGPQIEGHIGPQGAFYNEGVRLTRQHCDWIQSIINA